MRIHFQCRAELPIGSFLRVTGSSLWSPGTSASDPAEAAPVVGRTEQAGFPVAEHLDMEVNHRNNTSFNSLYTSSVEMVTTPEDYPLWRTRKPVVVVLNRHAAAKKSVQHHYYRYLVVSPGTTGDPYSDDDDDDDDEREPAGAIVCTSNEFIGSTVVMQWEDPFQTLLQHHHQPSAVSLASSIGLPTAIHTSSDYRNLPYRTLDIDVTAPQLTETQQDQWNVKDDASFQPFLIREAVRLMISK